MLDEKKEAQEGSPDRPYENNVEKSHIESLRGAEAQYQIDPVVDRRVTRKFDLHILPWLFGIWLLAFIDRSNIGNAKIDGLTEDLKLTGNKFNVALVVFYVPYIIVGTFISALPFKPGYQKSPPISASHERIGRHF